MPIEIPKDMGVYTELPKYVSHKEVWALKISAIELEEDGSAKIAFEGSGVAPMHVPDFAERFKGSEEDFGYYVQYKDGYKSWSPTKAFEEGYTLVK
jgi:hypothetical protein